ncbi:MAG: tellurium resistance protein, partial [Gemmobacter sp.]
MTPAPRAPSPARFARVPPAIFPPILGLWGLGLGWRAAGEAAGFGAAPGEVILGAVFLLWLGAVLAYGAKLARRPGVLAEEVRVLPGQSGLAALGMATMAGAGGVLPHAPGIGAAMLVAGFVAHVALAVGMARRLLAAPPEARVFSPVWHMIFVGPILAVAPAAALGFDLAAAAILGVTLANAAVLWVAGGRVLL